MPNLSQFKTKKEYTEWYRKYRKRNRLKLRKYNRDYNRNFRIKNGYARDSVRLKVFRAVKSGKIKRGRCEVCQKGGAEGHHPDYSKPLEVIWLCPLHHKDMHRKKNLSTVLF